MNTLNASGQRPEIVKLSLVIPVFNEAAIFNQLQRRLE